MCPHAFHTFFPYFITLSNGGWFDWVEPGDGVCVHCSSPEGIITKIYRDNGNVVRIDVVNVPGNCPCGYNRGERFLMSEFKFCPKAADILYGYMIRKRSGIVTVKCPSGDNSVIFDITFEDKGK